MQTIAASAETADTGAGQRGGAPWRWGIKAAVAAVDSVAVALAMVVAFVVWAELRDQNLANHEHTHVLIAVLSLPLWLLAFARAGLYRVRYVTGRVEELRRVARGVGTGIVATVIVGFILRLQAARGWLLLALLCGTVFVSAERIAVRQAFRVLRRRGHLLRPVVIVGGNSEGLALCAMLMTDPTLGYRVAGFVDDHAPADAHLYDHRPVLGTIAQTLDAVRRTGASGVFIATTALAPGAADRLARELCEAGVHVEISSSLRDISARRLFVRPVGRFPVVYVEPVKRTGWRAVAKRTFDLSVSCAALVLTAPVMLLAAAAVKLTSPGPVLFRQIRVGKDGKAFELRKLRTMVVGAEDLLIELRDRNEAEGPLFKLRADPRVTRVGRVLRRLSIDELPQLWNVVSGEMSLVGPRPALPEEMSEWQPELHARLRVKPGITGMWQVHGRSTTSFEDYGRLDLFYVDNWSLWSDVVIVARTIPTVLSGRGAC